MLDVYKSWKKHEYTVFVVIASSFGFMSIGSASGWASPSMVTLSSPDSPIPLTSSQLSWVASMIAVGGLTASLPFSYFLNRVGRKPMIVVVSLVYISGWITLIFSTEVTHLYIGRYLLGAGVGCTFSSIPVYIGEVVSPNVRGAIVTFLGMSQSIGALLSFSVGPLVPFQTLNTISLAIPILMGISFLLMPETPYFLLRKGKTQQAEKGLMKFRGCHKVEEIQEEIKNMEHFLNEGAKSNFWQSLKQLNDRKSKRAILIISVLVIGQQLSGIAAMTAYMQSIFVETNSPIKSNYAVILSEVLADISVIVTSLIMDKFGRKPLYSISSLICILANIGLGAYFYLRSIGAIVGIEYSWVPMVGIFIMRMGYDVGMAPVPMVVTSEILSFNIKGLVSSYFAFIQGAFMAVVLKVFQIIKDGIGQHYAHGMFALSITVAMLFVFIYMPETKNKSLLEIQQDFDRKGKNKSATPIPETYKNSNEVA